MTGTVVGNYSSSGAPIPYNISNGFIEPGLNYYTLQDGGHLLHSAALQGFALLSLCLSCRLRAHVRRQLPEQLQRALHAVLEQHPGALGTSLPCLLVSQRMR